MAYSSFGMIDSSISSDAKDGNVCPSSQPDSIQIKQEIPDTIVNNLEDLETHSESSHMEIKSEPSTNIKQEQQQDADYGVTNPKSDDCKPTGVTNVWQALAQGSSVSNKGCQKEVSPSQPMVAHTQEKCQSRRGGRRRMLLRENSNPVKPSPIIF